MAAVVLGAAPIVAHVRFDRAQPMATPFGVVAVAIGASVVAAGLAGGWRWVLGGSAVWSALVALALDDVGAGLLTSTAGAFACWWGALLSTTPPWPGRALLPATPAIVAAGVLLSTGSGRLAAGAVAGCGLAWWTVVARGDSGTRLRSGRTAERATAAVLVAGGPPAWWWWTTHLDVAPWAAAAGGAVVVTTTWAWWRVVRPCATSPAGRGRSVPWLAVPALVGGAVGWFTDEMAIAAALSLLALLLVVLSDQFGAASGLDVGAMGRAVATTVAGSVPVLIYAGRTLYLGEHTAAVVLTTTYLVVVVVAVIRSTRLAAVVLPASLAAATALTRWPQGTMVLVIAATSALLWSMAPPSDERHRWSFPAFVVVLVTAQMHLLLLPGIVMPLVLLGAAVGGAFLTDLRLRRPRVGLVAAAPMARGGVRSAALATPDPMPSAPTPPAATEPDAPSHAGTDQLADLPIGALGAWRFPAAVWSAIAAMLTLVQIVAVWFDQGLFSPLHGGRVVWDAELYVRVARGGYRLDEYLEAVFPAFPLAIRGFHALTGAEYEFSAVSLSAAAGLTSFVLFWRWMAIMGVTEPTRRRALVLFATYPYAFVLFGVAYADGLLLAFVLGAIVLVEGRHWVLAGSVGALATATRPNALPIVLALAVLTLERSGVWQAGRATTASSTVGRVRALGAELRGSRWRWDRLRPVHLAWLLALSGISAYAGWLRSHAGDPFYFWTVQSTRYTHRPITAPATWLKVEFIDRPWEFVHNAPDAANQVVHALILAAVVWSAPRLGRRFGWGYATLALALAAMTWASVMGAAPAGRYLLPCLPFFAVLLAERLDGHRRATRVVVTTFATGSLVLAVAFALVARLNW